MWHVWPAPFIESKNMLTHGISASGLPFWEGISDRETWANRRYNRNFKKLFPCGASLQLLYRWHEKTRFQVHVHLVTSAVNKQNQCEWGIWAMLNLSECKVLETHAMCEFDSGLVPFCVILQLIRKTAIAETETAKVENSRMFLLQLKQTKNG